MKEFRITLPKNLKKLRNKRGFTVERLSRRSGVRASMISSIESGTRKPSLNTLHMLCVGLKCKPDKLLLEQKEINYEEE